MNCTEDNTVHYRSMAGQDLSSGHKCPQTLRNNKASLLDLHRPAFVQTLSLSNTQANLNPGSVLHMRKTVH